LATASGWQHLRTTPAARVKAIRHGQQPWGVRIVVDLDRPTLGKSATAVSTKAKEDKGTRTIVPIMFIKNGQSRLMRQLTQP